MGRGNSDYDVQNRFGGAGNQLGGSCSVCERGDGGSEGGPG